MSIEEIGQLVEEVGTEDKIEGVRKSYWKRHLGMVVLSAILAYLPEKKVDASELAQQAVATETGRNTLEARRASYEKLKQIIEEGNTEEKVAKLREIYGRSIDDFLFVNRIERDLSTFKRVQSDADKNETWVSSQGPQVMTLGSILNDRFHASWEEKEAQNKEIKFKNIDKIPGLDEEGLKSFLEVKYPGSRISESVSSIEFVEQSVVRGDSQILGTTEVYGFDSMSKPGNDGRIEIKINLRAGGISKDEFLDTLSHELGHVVDWGNSRAKTSQQRVEMALEISERLEADDRYKSEYVESWINSDSLNIHADTKKLSEEERGKMLNYIKAVEYWAEIYRHFKDGDFKENHPRDFELVMRWGDLK